MIIKQIKVGFMEVFCYILGCETTQKGVLIDPAGDEKRIIDTAAGLGLTIESVVNTHGHPDHTCGNAKIKDLTGAKIYMHTLDDSSFNTPEGQSMERMFLWKTGTPSALAKKRSPSFTPRAIRLAESACMRGTTFLPETHSL
jgi:glyoxylase-like metal-dependent hydrolase (beta-lactamase superfamily II)